MNKAVSLYFDLLRGGAAVLVTYHHYNSVSAYPRRVFPDVGQDAVIFFFVLSGYIISWVADTRDRTLRDYVVNRLSRIYSVLLPSLLLGVLFTKAMHMVDPATYHPGNLANVPLRATLIALFSNYNNVFGAVNLAGLPTWSLTYEVWYYVIFAILVYLGASWQKVLCFILVAAYLGLEPLLLFPAWLMGSLFYRFRSRFHLPPLMAGFIFFASLAGMIVMNGTGLKHRLVVESVFGMSTNTLFVHSKYFLYFNLLAFLIGIHLFSAIQFPALHRWLDGLGKPVVWCIRRVAHTSFVLYLLHTPLMLLLRSLFGGPVFVYLLPTLAVVLIAVLGKPVEDSKQYYRMAFAFIADRWYPRPEMELES